jgi:hypothetical protein
MTGDSFQERKSKVGRIIEESARLPAANQQHKPLGDAWPKTPQRKKDGTRRIHPCGQGQPVVKAGPPQIGEIYSSATQGVSSSYIAKAC